MFFLKTPAQLLRVGAVVVALSASCRRFALRALPSHRALLAATPLRPVVYSPVARSVLVPVGDHPGGLILWSARLGNRDIINHDDIK